MLYLLLFVFLEKKPFAFTSDTISLEDVKLNLNFNETKQDNKPCYIFSAPSDTNNSPVSLQSDTSPHDTSPDRKYEMPLSASEESLANFADSLAKEENSKSIYTPSEEDLTNETQALLTNETPSSHDMLASTPMSPNTINRTPKVTFDSKPVIIVTGDKPNVRYI